MGAAWENNSLTASQVCSIFVLSSRIERPLARPHLRAERLPRPRPRRARRMRSPSRPCRQAKPERGPGCRPPPSGGALGQTAARGTESRRKPLESPDSGSRDDAGRATAFRTGFPILRREGGRAAAEPKCFRTR